MLREETVRVSFGCLMHDIGKPVLRAGGQTGDHSRQGYDYLKRLWEGDRDVLDCVRLHHAAALRAAPPANDSIAWIACVADNISAAADRRGIDTEESGFRRYLPLAPIFTHMNGEHAGFAVPPYPQTGELRLPLTNAAALSAEQYQHAVDALAPRLAELPRAGEWLDSLLCLLESYLSPFPSSTNTAESPDVSLYDHLRTTAAVGACICEYLHEKGERDYKKVLFDNEKSFMDEKAFLLYSADFSGIQRFIYTVASDKALRSLRSRSFFLELAMEHYADELLALCGVGRTNLLYTGGGHCYLLLPNTERVRLGAAAWNARFNDWLCAQFGVALFLAHGFTECSGNELINHPAEDSPYRQMFRRVSSALAAHKLRRYDASMLRRLNGRRADGGRECRICGRTDSLVDDRCEWCRLFVELSEKVQRCGVYYVSADPGAAYDFALPAADGTAYVAFMDEKTARGRMNGGGAVTRIYSKNMAYTGLRYSTRIYVGDYAYSNSIEQLARSSAGVKRIGVCRMDVDDLGQAFVAGFERPDRASAAERQHFVTLSRTAAFSRQMSLFFKCYINDILSGRFGGGDALAVTVVYSGGDDVFLLGAWDDAVEAAMRIRQCFAAFSCGALTISAGLALVDERYPVRLSADDSGALEERAKKAPGKSSICVFEPVHTYSWPVFRERVIGEKKAALEAFFSIERQERGTSYLYRTLDLLRAAQGADGRLQLARYAYLLARLEPPRESRGYKAYVDFSKKMYGWALNERDRAELITAIYIYVYENREEDKDGIQQ